MAALLTIEAANTDKLAMYLGECRDLGVTDPAAGSSTRASCAFTVSPTARPLRPVRDQERRRGRDPVDARRPQTLGRIDSLYALCEHSDLRLVNKRVLESLIKAGALDSLAARCRHRRVAAGAAVRGGRSGDRARRPAPARPRQGAVAAVRRQRRGRTGGARRVPLPDAPAWTEMQQLAVREGSARPLHERPSARSLRRRPEGVRRPPRLADLTASEADVWVGGIVSALRPLKTKKGDRMAVFMLDDVAGDRRGGGLPGDLRQARRARSKPDAMLLVRGKLEKDDESARLVATELMPIAQLRERTTREVAIHLAVPPHGRPTFEALAELLRAPPRRPPRVARARRQRPGRRAACGCAPTSPSGSGVERCRGSRAARSAGSSMRTLRTRRTGRTAAVGAIAVCQLTSSSSKSRSACC